MNLIKKIHTWIKQESTFSDDSNSMLFLIRFLLFAWIPYYFFIFIYTLTLGLYKFSAIIAIAVIIFSALLYLSHEIRVRLCTVFTCLTIIFLSFILTPAFGWRCSFQNMIYITFLILWYDSMLDIRIKMLISFIITTIICLISYTTKFGTTILNPDSVEYLILFYFNIMQFSICLSLVAYFYCTLYVDVEKNLIINNRKLKLMSETDPLTKLVNRRYAQNELKEIEKSKKCGAISIAIGDIDYFKRANDTYGHECGDYVLATLAEYFKNTMDKQGYVARWGGEEFLFVFKDKNGDEALRELEILRENISNTILNYKDQTFSVTMTFGLEEYSPLIGFKDTIIKADEKLYLGKQSGRNRTVY